MKKYITQGFYIGISFIFTISIFGFIAFKVYAALNNVNSGDVLTADNWNNIVSEINSLKTTVSTLNTIPSGSIVAFNSTTCPTGWSKANGTNGTPDLRGEFIRGWDDGKGTDSGRTIASSQNATRVFHFTSDDSGRGGRQVDMDNLAGADFEGSAELAYTRSTYVSLATAGNISNPKVYGIRVRPRNIALLYCVKN